MAKHIFHQVRLLRQLLNANARSWPSMTAVEDALFQAGNEVWRRYYDVYQKTRKVSDAMAPFLREVLYSTDGVLNAQSQALALVRGQLYLPAGGPSRSDGTADDVCRHYTRLSVPGAKAPVQWVDDMQLVDALNDPLAGPTLTHPFATASAQSIRVYPDTITNVQVQYLTGPKRPVYVETIVGGLPTYDDLNSVDMGFAEEQTTEIIIEACRVLGLEYRDAGLLQGASAMTAPVTA